VFHRRLAIEQPEQILPGDQGGILGTLEKRPDILDQGLA
jgi:hypothetical protein